MFVPFVGLSILAHVAIITYNKLFPDVHPKRNKSKHTMLFNRILGTSIIIFMFSFVSVFATSLVFLSVGEKHSTLMFIEYNHELHELGNAIYSATIKIDAVS